MGYPTKVQLIERKDSQQWYINFPAPLAQAMEFEKGEVIEWVIQDRYTLVLHRTKQGQVAERSATVKAFFGAKMAGKKAGWAGKGCHRGAAHQKASGTQAEPVAPSTDN